MVSFPFRKYGRFSARKKRIFSKLYSTYRRKEEDERKEGSLESFEGKFLFFFFFKENELLTSYQSGVISSKDVNFSRQFN